MAAFLCNSTLVSILSWEIVSSVFCSTATIAICLSRKACRCQWWAFLTSSVLSMSETLFCSSSSSFLLHHELGWNWTLRCRAPSLFNWKQATTVTTLQATSFFSFTFHRRWITWLLSKAIIKSPSGASIGFEPRLANQDFKFCHFGRRKMFIIRFWYSGFIIGLVMGWNSTGIDLRIKFFHSIDTCFTKLGGLSWIIFNQCLPNQLEEFISNGCSHIVASDFPTSRASPLTMKTLASTFSRERHHTPGIKRNTRLNTYSYIIDFICNGVGWISWYF